MKAVERGKKKIVVAELEAKLQQANSMFVTEYLGMNVAQMSRLRRELRNIGVEFIVTKNTLLKIAARGTKAESLNDFYNGPNAIACVAGDPASAARVIHGFSKEVPSLKVKAGFLGDHVLSPEDIQKLATLPTKEVLLGKFVGLLQAVPQRLVYVLAGNVAKLVYTLDAIKRQKAQA